MKREYNEKEKCYIEKINALEEENSKLRVLAYSDYLTNTHNRNYFFDHYTDNQVFKIIMIDVNNLKCINDTLGHTAGDNLLVEVTDKLRKFGDVIRYGGDEFILITPIDFDEALLEDDRYCFGICNKTEGQSINGALELADKKLYRNKKCRKSCE